MTNPLVQTCPRCGKESLTYNRVEARWVCFDPACRYQDR